IRGFWPNDHLVHVKHAGSVIHRSTFSNRHHGQRVVVAHRSQHGAIDWVNGVVNLRAQTITHGVPVIQHGRLIFFAFANHDGAVHVHGVQKRPHGIYGSTIGNVLLAKAHPFGSSDRGSLGNADEFHCEVAVLGTRTLKLLCRRLVGHVATPKKTDYAEKKLLPHSRPNMVAGEFGGTIETYSKYSGVVAKEIPSLPNTMRLLPSQNSPNRRATGCANRPRV